jgi:hypothetical protein
LKPTNSDTNSRIETEILKVSEPKRRLDLESVSLTRKKPPASNEMPIEINNIPMYILKSSVAIVFVSKVSESIYEV